MEFLAAALVLGLFVVPFGVPVTALVRLVAVLAVPVGLTLSVALWFAFDGGTGWLPSGSAWSAALSGFLLFWLLLVVNLKDDRRH